MKMVSNLCKECYNKGNLKKVTIFPTHKHNANNIKLNFEQSAIQRKFIKNGNERENFTIPRFSYKFAVIDLNLKNVEVATNYAPRLVFLSACVA